MPIELSLVIPAYNEAARLPPFLTTVKAYLPRALGERYEVIVVDDGSDDALEAALRPITAAWPQFTLLRHAHNRGKGAAVCTGVLAACGQLVLVADADGATPVEEEGKLRRAIMGGALLAVGSRYLRAEGQARTRLWYRDACGALFARAARLLLALPVRDTQCGFKMFRRDVGRHLVGLCREQGYLLDVELLLWAQRFGYETAEIPISWQEVPGSKVRLVRDGWRLLHGLWRLRRAFRAGRPVVRPLPAAHSVGSLGASR